MNEFVTLASLGTFAGIVAAVLFLTQFFKEVKPFCLIHTRFVAWIFAIILQAIVTAATGSVIWTDYALALINSVLIAITSMGAYDLTFKPGDDARKTLATTKPPEV